MKVTQVERGAEKEGDPRLPSQEKSAEREREGVAELTATDLASDCGFICVQDILEGFDQNCGVYHGMDWQRERESERSKKGRRSLGH